MTGVTSALGKAISQLGDSRILMVLAKTILLTLAVFALIGFGLFAALIGPIEQLTQSYSSEIGALLALILTAIGGWLLFRVVALAVLQFFADEGVLAVEAKHYPALASSARKLPFREELANSLKGMGRTLLANLVAAIVAILLLFTAIGPAILFWAVNAWLLGRELQDMVWLRHRRSAEEPAPLGKIERFILGGAVAALLIVPFINLLAPIIGAASATHLVHRKIGAGKIGNA